MEKQVQVPKRFLAYALRYAIGRATGAVDDVMEQIALHRLEFKEWELKRMAEDIFDHFLFHTDVPRKAEWHNFANQLQEWAEETKQ